MRRREFITLLGSAAALPFVAHGQQAPRTVPLVGAIWPGKPSAPISVRIREAFLQGLREDGYIEGHNIAIEHRYAVRQSIEKLRAGSANRSLFRRRFHRAPRESRHVHRS